MFATHTKYISKGRDSVVREVIFKTKQGKNIPLVCKSMRAEDFNKEVSRLVGHDNPNLEKIIHIWLTRPNTLLFCERLDKTLSKAIIRDITHELDLAMQILNGLKFLHEKMRLAHCDLKENNIMIDNTDTLVKIIDFNNCVFEPQFGKFELGVTLAKKHKDLLIDPKNWDWRVDFWACGCTLFRVKHGRDIIDEFLTRNNIEYDTMESRSCPISQKLLLYNFYKQKIKEFKNTEFVIYACMKATTCFILSEYFLKIKDFLK